MMSFPTAATVTAALAVIPAAVAAYHKLTEVLRPLLQRRRLRVVILATAATLPGATAFAGSLRCQGYREVAVTTVVEAAVGAQAVVAWEVAGADVPSVIKASQVAPEATLLVLTYDALQGLPRGPKWLLCNSPVRLRGDLAAVAESTP
jgi:hypothetical protein